MPYVPDPDKLAAMGFRLVDAFYRNETRYWRYQDAYDAPGLEWAISVYPDQQLHLLEGGGWVSEEGGDPVFIGHCPSEDFFNQLIQAVGWPAPPATHPAP